MELLKQQVEALIFCSEQSISLEEIAASLKLSFDWDLEDEAILEVIADIKAKYDAEEYSFELVEISEGFQFLSKKQYHPAISALIQHKAKKKLSVSQMETLAIIAYRQPVSKAEIEHIRGVSCDYAIHKLLEKELIEIFGKGDGPGRPVLYCTSRTFMDYFGIKSVKDLPQLKDLQVEENSIGMPFEMSEENIPAFEEEVPVDVPSEEIPAEETAALLSEDEYEDIPVESDEPITADLLDRRSIYLENETKIQEEEEKLRSDDTESYS